MNTSISLKQSLLAVTLWIVWGTGIAHAQTPQAHEVSANGVAETQAAEKIVTSAPTYVLIGQETEHLLAIQRSAPAHRNRWIDGDQAGRSYARYLKSFEHPIPEKYESEDGFQK